MARFGQRKIIDGKEYEYKRDSRGGNYGSWFLVGGNTTSTLSAYHADTSGDFYDSDNGYYSEADRKVLEFEGVIEPGSVSEDTAYELLDTFNSMSEDIDHNLVNAPTLEIHYSTMDESEVLDYLTEGSNSSKKYTSVDLLDNYDKRGFKTEDGKYFFNVDTSSMLSYDDNRKFWTNATNDQIIRMIDEFEVLEDRDKENIAKNKKLIEKISKDNPSEIKRGYGIYNGTFDNYVVDSDKHTDQSEKLNALKDQVACDRLLDSVTIPENDLSLSIDRDDFTRGARIFSGANKSPFSLPSVTNDGGRDDVILTTDGHCVSKNKPNKPGKNVNYAEIGRTGHLFEQAVDYYDKAREMVNKYPMVGSQLNGVRTNGMPLTNPEKAAFTMAYVAETAQVRDKYRNLDMESLKGADSGKIEDAYYTIKRNNPNNHLDDYIFLVAPNTPTTILDNIVNNRTKSYGLTKSEISALRAHPNFEPAALEKWLKENPDSVKDTSVNGETTVTKDPINGGHFISFNR